MPPASWEGWGELRRAGDGLQVEVWAAGAESSALGREFEAQSGLVHWLQAPSGLYSMGTFSACVLWSCRAVYLSLEVR